MSILTNLFSNNEKELKRYRKLVRKINALEDQISQLSDAELQEKTVEFKQRLSAGETLDEIMIEAFAVVREASKRVLHMRHYDVQLIGGMALHDGNISEMKTGEGKTLVSTLPAYLNALSGNGVHIITVNEYLAQRDSQEMGALHQFLGLSVGLNKNNCTHEEKKQAYACDITYGTNNEFGFDYLRDNMALYAEEKSQRGHTFAILDEVDSILIDEARTPLIISGNSGKSADLYKVAQQFVQSLVSETDYTFDIKDKSSQLTEVGVSKAEKYFGIDNLFDAKNMKTMHHVNQALRAVVTLRRDVDYVVQENEIVIVDQFTGRLMPGRRFSDGLHQAIEAKEKVTVQKESKTLATITFQNYFRLYDKLSGMTGTAKTEESEFRAIYGISVLVIPTNKPILRVDSSDTIYKTKEEKFEAVAAAIKTIHETGQPILVGTIDIETSELLAELLKKRCIPHTILNAKHHEKEAEIISLAGQRNAVTISTNMAGRGTDIKLGEGVAAIGGLAVIGTERHESRRIDNQLRGRAGRQGDPGSSRFYISLEDELMKRFGSESMASAMERLGIDKGQAIESKLITKAVESAQKRVEGNNFDSRKRVLKYDDVLNEQRTLIYKQRNEVLENEDVFETIQDMFQSVSSRLIDQYISSSQPDADYPGLCTRLNTLYFDKSPILPEDLSSLSLPELTKELSARLKELHISKQDVLNERFIEVQKVILLQSVDSKWIEHIDSLMELRQGIQLRSYAQVDPLLEYQYEAFKMFESMVRSIEEEVTSYILRATLTEQVERKQVMHIDSTSTGSTSTPKKPATSSKIGRNSLCSCGSGKKYKHCHGLNS